MGNTENWPERKLFVHNQGVIDPIKWKQTSVMADRWRLVDNTELYAFTLRERPEVAAFPLTATEARLRVGNLIDEKQKVGPGATSVRLQIELKAGDTEVQSWLIENDGSSRGAYFVEVERLGKPE